MAANTIIVHLKRSVKFTLVNVDTETKEDVELYQRKTYRNHITAADVGGVGTVNMASDVPTANSIVAKSDLYTFVAPIQEMLKRSRYVWKDASAVQLGWAWCDEIISVNIVATATAAGPSRF